MRPLKAILTTFYRFLVPEHSMLLLAIIAVAGLMTYGEIREPPIGGIDGQVILADNFKSVENAVINLSPANRANNTLSRREVISGENGVFRIRNITPGEYVLSAYTSSHACGQIPIEVTEGSNTSTILSLQRSKPDVNVGDFQNVYTLKDKIFIPVRGYVNSRLPAGMDKLKVQIYKSTLSAIFMHPKAIRALIGMQTQTQNTTSLPKTLLENSERYQSISIPLIHSDREGFYAKRFPLGKPGCGLYFINITHGDSHACAWLMVTDSALIVKRGGRNVIAWAVNINSGQPLPNESVEAYYAGKRIASGITNNNGIVHFRIPALQHQSDHIEYVSIRGKDESAVESYLYSSDGDKSYAVHSYTDRPLYRPGQTIYYKSIIRKIIIRGWKYMPPVNTPVKIEVRDPSGIRIMDAMKRTNSYGSINGKLALSPEAPTGVYSMICTIGGEIHSHDIVIASYKKPEFKASVSFEKDRYTQGSTLVANVSSQYYFGSPLSGAKLQWNVFRSIHWQDSDMESWSEGGYGNAWTPRYQGFGDGDIVASGTTKLDQNGRCTLHIPTSIEKPPVNTTDITAYWGDHYSQDYDYSISVTVIAASGKQATANASTLVTAGDFRIRLQPNGYLFTPGKPNKVRLYATDYSGAPIRNQPVELDYGYTRTIHYSDYGDQATLYAQVGSLHAVTDKNGHAIFDITFPRSGQTAILAYTQDSHHRFISDNLEIYCVTDQGADYISDVSDLSIFSDRTQYLPGQNARILISSKYTGQTVLLTIEGNTIHMVRTVKMTRRQMVVRIPIKPEYGPNIYLDACFVRHRNFSSSEAPLKVSIQRKRLSVRITPENPASAVNKSSGKPPAFFQPGRMIAYRVVVRDSKGKPVRSDFSLGVVDESIYALQEDDPNSVISAFYPQRYNNVQTDYSFSVQYLGDADKSEPKITARKRFPDTAFWAPDVQTNQNGVATVAFALPDSITQWRATVVAQTRSTLVGAGINRIIVKKRFFVMLDTPRYLTQSDHSHFNAYIHNETGETQTVMAHLQATDVILQDHPILRTVIPAGSIGELKWPVIAMGDKASHIRLTAWTLPEKGRQFTDGVEIALPLKPHAMDEFHGSSGSLLRGGEAKVDIKLDSNAIPQLSRLSVRINPSLFSCMDNSLDYLVDYPYGCTEQTLSRFIPDILVKRALEKYGMHLSQRRERELPAMIRDSLTRLYRFQHPSGCWGWWEYDPDDPYLTGYAMYALSVAKDLGYPVSHTVISKAIKGGEKMLQSARQNDKPVLMYGLICLGDQQAVMKARNIYLTRYANLTALSWLMLVDAKLNLPDTLSSLLASRLVRNGAMLHYRSKLNQWDSDDVDNTARIFKAIVMRNPNDPRVEPLLLWIMAQRTDNYWISTWYTSDIIDALCEYVMRSTQKYNPKGSISVSLNGKVVRTYTLTQSIGQENALLVNIPSSQLHAGKNSLSISRNGGNTPIFYSVLLRQSVRLPANAPPPASPIKIQREYFRITSNLERITPWSPWTLHLDKTGNIMRTGDNVRVRLTITTPTAIPYAIIEDPYPAGCEVAQSGDVSDESWTFWYSSIDVRDSKVVFFARSIPKGKHIIEYTLQARINGVYHAMPAVLQGMYDPEYHGQSQESVITIK